jgi:cytoskeleton protein RodZ
MTSPLREDENKPLQDVASPGKRLRIARQAKGLSHSEVAAHLHLSSAIVQALEQDDHDRLPGPVFVRGYLRNYARLLGLDDKTFVAELDHPGADEQEAPAVTKTRARPEIHSNHFAVRLVSWLIGISLIVLLALWWQGRLNWEAIEAPVPEQAAAPSAVDEDGALRLPEPDAAPAALPSIEPASAADNSNEQPDRAAPTPTDTPPATPAVVSEPADEPDAAPLIAEESRPAAPQTSERQPPATAASPPPAPADATEPEADLKPAAAGVVFEFSGPCWVDIRDSTRKFKIFGEMRKGDRRTLEGVPPYSVILGNAPTVSVFVNGEKYDVQAHARGSVARFSLDPDSLEQN